ncbi:nucleotidyltransferase domain-containing protein [Paenibacillus psychroresistens]|nr:nucleotidyltransferase domain-containing protein [Paenibacillus psychroresistens]
MLPIPDRVQAVLDAYFQLLDSKLLNFLEAYYIYGSISLGAFTKNYSDIDFVAIVKQEITADKLALLKEIHLEIQQRFPKRILDGKYITSADMQQVNHGEQSYCYFNEGKYRGVRQFNKNSIDAYQLKVHGIAVKGQESNKLDYTIDWDILLHDMKGNLNYYWVNWRNKCERFLTVSYIGLFCSGKMAQDH